MHKLPSINLLLTFESAARHLSFKKASAELYVTPAAVSHQVKALEQALNTKLFVRLNRALELTEQGRRYFLDIQPAISQIKAATNEIITDPENKSLTIHSIPFANNNIIAPNLKSFNQQFPELSISMSSSFENVDLEKQDSSSIHLALRLGRKEKRSLVYEVITEVKVSPVCASHCSTEQMKTKINLTVDKNTWGRWMADWNQLIEFDTNLNCDGLHASVEMAEQGVGLAMGYFPFANAKVASGSLVLPYPDKVSVLGNLYLVYPKQYQDDPVVNAFSTWIKAVLITESK